jgi:hypothetical protein
MIGDRQAAPIERLHPATSTRSEIPAFVLWDDPSNQAEDWQEAANKIHQVTLISYFSPEPAQAPQIIPSWASLAEEASKRWLKDNPF